MPERSQGAVRPSLPHLPRAGQLSPTGADTARERDGDRDGHGRFSHGNRSAGGRGWKMAIAKMIGREVADPVAQAVANDAWRLYLATVRELPSDGV
jgi:hypothetical protein